jgi:hypothetical protein
MKYFILIVIGLSIIDIVQDVLNLLSSQMAIANKDDIFIDNAHT